MIHCQRVHFNRGIPLSSPLTLHPGIPFWQWAARTNSKNSIKHATKITGVSQTQLSELYCCAVKRKRDSIIEDPSHPLHCLFQLLPSGRWFTAPLATKRTSIPPAICTINNKKNHTTPDPIPLASNLGTFSTTLRYFSLKCWLVLHQFIKGEIQCD